MIPAIDAGHAQKLYVESPKRFEEARFKYSRTNHINVISIHTLDKSIPQTHVIHDCAWSNRTCRCFVFLGHGIATSSQFSSYGGRTDSCVICVNVSPATFPLFRVFFFVLLDIVSALKKHTSLSYCELWAVPGDSSRLSLLCWHHMAP